MNGTGTDRKFEKLYAETAKAGVGQCT
jgi:hypothetical protein